MREYPKRHAFITVIVASKNSVDTLQRCISSFVNQTYQYKELIIVDGGSTDGTVEIIKEHSKNIAHWESEPDRGIAHAWNKALKYANGEWILFLGSDDYFIKLMVLEEFINKIADQSITNKRVVYGTVKKVLPCGEYLNAQGMDWPVIKSQFFSEKMMIPHPACFTHYSVFLEYGNFDENFSIAVDYEFLLRVLKKEEVAFIPDYYVTVMTFGGISSKISTLLTMQKECDRALMKHGFTPTGYRRRGNILVYKLLGYVIRFGGERMASRMLDMLRIILRKAPLWTRK